MAHGDRSACTREWTAADVEPVSCCVCHIDGDRVYDLPPFAVVRCPRCRLAFVSPRLRTEALQAVYDDVGYFEGGVYGSTWSPAMVLQRVWTAGRLGLIRAALSRPPAGTRMLEVGCGYGLFLAAARQRGYDVTGVELSRSASRHARDVLDLSVHQGQLDAAVLDGRYDVIAAWDTLEHVPDPVAFLRTARTLLADDGVLVFSTPYFSSLPARLLRTRWWTLKPTEHIWHFTPQSHHLVFARAGLAVTRILRNPLAPANFGRLDSLVGVARRIPDLT
ncbi:MAG: class I SAM-dependent methyltransferase [Geodermatophilaceae bacterium]|nr:class I SAM-dependent methyltransferase [Geodermatophilaceae bacterium]MDQ3465686.1 class I SAM-dependent methyltransferase [Actinomycetota bacterium]